MSNNQNWPPEVSESLQRWILDSREPAVLVTDNCGSLLSRGGELSHYGLADLRPGDRVAERAYFLEGLLPLEGESLSLFRVEALPGVFADIYVSSVTEGDCVLLLDASADVAERARIEQALRHTEERLRHAEKMQALGRLAGGVAHDFNNLLTIILGYSNLLAREGASGPSLEAARQIVLAAESAAGMTHHLLSFSRRQAPRMEALDLNQIISGLEKPLRRLIGEDLMLTVILDPAAGPVNADRGQMEQILVNLAANARDAMPSGGSLEIRTDHTSIDESYLEAYPNSVVSRGPHIRLTVSDTGCGMDAETMERAFEPFFTSKRAGQGTGLGLAIVYGIVTQTGGDIHLSSELGRGTRVEILLPEAHEPARQESVPAKTLLPAGTETVLVVEDQDGVRHLVCDVLTGLGYTVMESPDPLAAIAHCEEHPGKIDLLLTDLVMPRIDGSELAKHVSASHPDLRVLYVSGYAPESLTERGVSLPENVFLKKPFTPGLLAEKVREALAQPSPIRHASKQRA